MEKVYSLRGKTNGNVLTKLWAPFPPMNGHLLWLVCHILSGKAVSHSVESLNLFPFVATSHLKPLVKKCVSGDGVAVLQHKKGNNKKNKNIVNFFKRCPSLPQTCLLSLGVVYTFGDPAAESILVWLHMNFKQFYEGACCF